MLKRGDVNDDADDDDEVRITAKQNRLIETLSTEEFSLRTQYLQLSPHICREV
jgi:hypothetical protein